MNQPRRIEPLSIADARASSEAGGLRPDFAELSIFRTLLHHPVATQPIQQLITTFMWKGKLEPRLRELAIMRIGWLTGADYEWTQHWHVARRAGVPEADLAATRDWPAYAGFDELDRIVLQATDETVRDGSISDATWQRCRALLGTDERCIELAGVIGCWRMVASLLLTLEVSLDEGLTSWPPDGQGPPGARNAS